MKMFCCCCLQLRGRGFVRAGETTASSTAVVRCQLPWSGRLCALRDESRPGRRQRRRRLADLRQNISRRSQLTAYHLPADGRLRSSHAGSADYTPGTFDRKMMDS